MKLAHLRCAVKGKVSLPISLERTSRAGGAGWARSGTKRLLLALGPCAAEHLGVGAFEILATALWENRPVLWVSHYVKLRAQPELLSDGVVDNFRRPKTARRCVPCRKRS